MASTQDAADAGSGSGYLALWSAQAALHDLAAEIARDILEAVGPTSEAGVLLVEDRDLLTRDLRALRVVDEIQAHTALLHDAVGRVRAALALASTEVLTPQAAPDEPSPALLPVGDLLSLLGTETAVAPRPVPASTAALTAAVAQELLGRTPVVVDGFTVAAPGGPVLAALDAALEGASELRTVLRLAEEHSHGPTAQEVAEQAGRAAAVLASWESTLARLTTSDGPGPAPLSTAAQGALLLGAGPVPGHVVALRMDQTGADQITRTGPLGRTGRVRVIGGVTASWLVLRTSDGTLVRAGSGRRGTRLVYDVRTGGHETAAVNDEPGTPLRTSVADWWQQALVVVLAVAAAGWLLVDTITRL